MTRPRNLEREDEAGGRHLQTGVVMVRIMERLRTRTKADAAEEVKELAVRKTRSSAELEGEALLAAFNNADAVLAQLERERTTAQLAVKTARAGTGADRAAQTLAEVQADRVLTEVEARRDAAYRRRTEAAVKLADHAATSREAQEAALLALQEESDAALTAFAPRLDAYFREGEGMAVEAMNLLVAREKAWPERAVIIAKNGPSNIMGTGRPGWDSRKAVLLGGGDPHVSVGLLFSLFRNDPRALYGGPVQHWRGMAEEAGLLPMSTETKAKLDSERQHQADALVRNALAESWTRERLGKVWGDADRRDLGMK